MSRELDVAIEAAKAAGKEIVKRYGKVEGIREKSERLGLVTDADLAAQKKVKEVISAAFPDACFLAEEDKEHNHGSSPTWIVDPLDGTMNFVRGVNFFSVSIALFRENQVVLGVVFDPLRTDLFHAEKGKGAFHNGKKIQVSDVAETEDGLINIALPRREGTRKQNFELFEKMFEKMGTLRVLGSAALQLALVAKGVLDTYLEYGLYPWDVAAGMLLIEEAGGRITNEKGEQLDIFKDQSFIATNGKLHEHILEALGK